MRIKNDDSLMDVDADYDEPNDGKRRKRKYRKRGPKKKYCLCRSTKCDTFMIYCDGCKEWFHGTCVGINETQASKIEKYYCMVCEEKQNELKKRKAELEASLLLEKDSKPTNLLSAKRLKEDKDFLPEEFDDDDEEFQLPSTKRKYHKRQYNRTASKTNKSKKSTDNVPKKRGRKKGQSNKAKENRGRKRKNVDKKSYTRSRQMSHSDESADEVKSLTPRQCHGLSCVKVALKGSKYCSDQCGLNLARKRIELLLPDRIKEWQSVPSDADERSRKELEEIKLELMKSDKQLREIEIKKQELETIITKGKQCIPYTEKESAAILENDENIKDEITCNICVAEVPVRNALKHMERCFNRIEIQTVFESSIDTKNGLLCEAFNPDNNSYCKKLRIMCPEHNREPRRPDNEVCGCPLRSDERPFEDEPDKFCRFFRKKCIYHYGWEKIRQAVLDAEMLAQYLKMDNLVDRQNKVKQQMKNRGGLLQLLLHRTKYED